MMKDRRVSCAKICMWKKKKISVWCAFACRMNLMIVIRTTCPVVYQNLPLHFYVHTDVFIQLAQNLIKIYEKRWTRGKNTKSIDSEQRCFWSYFGIYLDIVCDDNYNAVQILIFPCVSYVNEAQKHSRFCWKRRLLHKHFK